MSMRFLILAAVVGLGLPAPSRCAPPPPEQVAAVRRYVGLLRDADPLVRKRAAVALGRMGAKAREAVPALEEALDDTSAEVRSAVAAALEAIDPVAHVEKPTLAAPSAHPPSEEPAPPKPSPTSPRPPREIRFKGLGTYYFGPKSLPSILVARDEADGRWRRLKAGARVAGGQELLSLPGYAGELRLDCGVHLLLRGHVREFSLPDVAEMDYLQECAVVLHKPTDTDADLTLRRGRLYLSNHSDYDLVVRLRFEGQAWKLTLRPGAEMAVDLLKRLSSAVDYHRGEEPIKTLHLLLLRGRGGVALGTSAYPDLHVPGPAYFRWENKPTSHALGPENVTRETLDKTRPIFAATPPPGADDMVKAVETLSQAVLPDRDPVVALQEVLRRKTDPPKSEALMRRRLAVYGLGALDAANELLNALGRIEPERAADREAAVFALRRWLGRDAAQGPKLYDEQKRTGLLTAGGRYRPREAEVIYRLLHDFADEQLDQPETYEMLARHLVNDKVAVAELAAWHLSRLARFWGVGLPALAKFNAARPLTEREAAAAEVIDKVRHGLLPARVPRAPAPPRPAPRK